MFSRHRNNQRMHGRSNSRRRARRCALLRGLLLTGAAFLLAASRISYAQPPRETPTSDSSERIDLLRRESDAGGQWYAQGRYDLAAARMRRALEIAEEIYDPSHAEYQNCLNNLAVASLAMGDYGRAQRLLQIVAESAKEAFGDQSEPYALAMNNLGGIYQSVGDTENATRALDTAWQIRRQVCGAAHEDTLTSLNNLAGLNLETGKLDEARRQFAEVVALRERTVGMHDQRYAASLANLAAAGESLGAYAEAERHYRTALAIQEETLGAEHPATATTCNNLGVLLSKRGRAEEAHALLRRALRVRQVKCGELHPLVAASMNNLAVHFRRRQQWEHSLNWYRQALDVQERLVGQMLLALPHRQQILLLAQLRRSLDGYLSVAPLAGADDAEMYGHALNWKGMAFARQWAGRHSAHDERADQLMTELRLLSGKLATTTFAAADANPPKRREQLTELARQRERIEADLAGILGEDSVLAPAQVPRIQESLPPEVVLIDFLEYWRSAAPADAEAATFQPRREVVAFLVSGESVSRIDLGSAQQIDQWVETWRRTCGAPGKGADAGVTIRDEIWAPLVANINPAHTILLSPDGALATLPFGALPGKRRGTYLIEERSLVTVPVPRLLPAMNTPRRDQDSNPPSRHGLLLLGDVDYGRHAEDEKNAAASPVHVRQNFTPLSGSRSEILLVEDSFQSAFGESASCLKLRGEAASESEFLRQAPHHRYLHVATHGFFVPSTSWMSAEGLLGEGRESLPALDPGLFCGLALAGANERRDGATDDGLLTASEVAAMDLRGVDLAVLSACETGLGEIAAGEGVLGLQRAFQLAGARSVVASLWQVDDRATRELMERFYENLWNEKQPMSKVEALRRAQLALLREARTRGVSLASNDAEKHEDTRTPPYFWAAFVLSGDWR
jgi:CHAT domain-containing protein/tetratricopeptide (TPR) repeat protein